MTSSISAQRRVKRYVLHRRRWSRCYLTWAFRDPFRLFHTDADYRLAKSAISRAIHTWERDSGGTIRFIDVSPPSRLSSRNRHRVANIDVLFAQYGHGDLESFDGPGGTVAHSAYPREGIVHFDASENWSMDERIENSVDLRYVVMVGDDIEGDVRGAQNCGIRAIQVKTGKYRKEIIEESGVTPDFLADNLLHAVNFILDGQYLSNGCTATGNANGSITN